MDAMRVLGVAGVLLVTAIVHAQTPRHGEPYEPLSAAEKLKIYSVRTIDPSGLAKSAFTAAINHWENDPHEWGQGMKGYGRRYGHRLANRAVENAIGFGVATALKQDPRYFYSSEQGAWPRVKHAVVHSFVTRTDSGGRTFATWRFAGNYGGAFVSNTWRPDRINGVGDALQRGTIAIGFDVGANVFKEFWPDIKRRVFRADTSR
jgi:hypothetical protein